MYASSIFATSADGCDLRIVDWYSSFEDFHMNWDISIGQCKQVYGRAMQALGRRLDRRSMVLEGERIEFGGRLQTRYGLLKHEVQWNPALIRVARDERRVDRFK